MKNSHVSVAKTTVKKTAKKFAKKRAAKKWKSPAKAAGKKTKQSGRKDVRKIRSEAWLTRVQSQVSAPAASRPEAKRLGVPNETKPGSQHGVCGDEGTGAGSTCMS
jgi:hypothetical protein